MVDQQGAGAEEFAEPVAGFGAPMKYMLEQLSRLDPLGQVFNRFVPAGAVTPFAIALRCASE